MKKTFLISLATVLLFSFIVSKNVSYASNTTNLENLIEEEIYELADEIDINLNNINVELEPTELIVNFQSNEYEGTLSIDSSLINLNSSNQNIIYTEKTESGTEEYSVFFGTLEEKKEMDAALDADEQTLQTIGQSVVPEESITIEDYELIEPENITDESERDVENEITLQSSVLIEQTDNVITTPEELSKSPIVYTNTETLESQEVLFTDGVAAAVTLAAGIVLSAGLIAHLIAIGIAFIAAGVILLTLEYISENSKARNKSYNHYAVQTHNSGKLKGKIVVLGGISYKNAVARLKISEDVWSVTSTSALKIAKAASPIGKSTSSELHGGRGSGYFKHYHPAISKVNGKYKYRISAHSYYGEPA